MAEFQSDFQSFKPSIPLLDITDQNMVLINQFQDLNNLQSLMAFSNDNFFCPQEAEFPGNLADNFPAIFQHCHRNSIPDSQPAVVPKNEFHESKKRKEIDVSESSSGISSTPLSDAGIKSKNSSRRKRAKSNIEKEEEKPKDVVHVRARRGQATDSHSLAERVRRGKINEKLRCLQDIVPGCYKTMGMSVMLDEIINYVQSLQNQVEFLSMKLTAASTFYDFNSETDAIETMQTARAYEAQEMERLMRVRGHGGHGSLHSTWSL